MRARASSTTGSSTWWIASWRYTGTPAPTSPRRTAGGTCRWSASPRRARSRRSVCRPRPSPSPRCSHNLGRSSAFGDSLRSGPGSYPEGPQAVRIDDMMPDPAKLLEEALKLSPESRAALAASLLQSLDGEVDEDAEAAWAAEIAKRIRELDSGAVMAIPWSEARRRILDR